MDRDVQRDSLPHIDGNPDVEWDADRNNDFHVYQHIDIQPDPDGDGDLDGYGFFHVDSVGDLHSHSFLHFDHYGDLDCDSDWYGHFHRDRYRHLYRYDDERSFWLPGGDFIVALPQPRDLSGLLGPV